MACSRCAGIERQFDATVARRQLRRYRKKGVSKTTGMLLDALSSGGTEDASFLDIGGGIGVVQHELMDAGASGGTSVEASTAYLEAARGEAEARGFADRVRYVAGDFVDLQAQVEEADLVSLDRVVCCYPDMPALVDASATRARRAYGLVYPRDRRLVRLGIGVLNCIQRIRRHPFRAYVHPTSEVEARVRSHGFRKTFQGGTLLWQVAVFSRP